MKFLLFFILSLFSLHMFWLINLLTLFYSSFHKVSPVDGRILHYGEVKNGLIEQVKGVNFTLPAFLGPQTWLESQHWQGSQVKQPYYDNLQAYVNNIKNSPDNCLYCCVIYLAPNDYHRFHSPIEWRVHFRRHFPGKLYSVHGCIFWAYIYRRICEINSDMKWTLDMLFFTLYSAIFSHLCNHLLWSPWPLHMIMNHDDGAKWR